MKPRNKFQAAVLAQSTKLPRLSRAQTDWAFRTCIEHFAYRLPKGRTTCMDCGHTWVTDKQTATCVCPHCRAKLQVRPTLERKLVQRRYFNMLTTCGGYQVLRMFLLHSSMEKGCKARTHAIEIGSYWWDGRGRQCIIAVQRVLGRYVDAFSYCSPLAVRGDNEAYRYAADSYLHPSKKLIPELVRNGYGEVCNLMPLTRLIPALLGDSKAETLVKAGQYELAKLYICRPFDITPYWSAVKICIRNRYFILDAAMWKDYVDMLRRLGKDTANARYVCPEVLQTAHDECARKINRIQQQRIRREQQETARMLTEEYTKAKGRFFGLAFSEGDIQVKVLESVTDFLDEGTAMHHCVYAAQYYKKDDALIFSATMNGQRIETVEVSLSKWEVVQSRGVCNKNTEYHDSIIALVNKNMDRIKARQTS